MRKINYMVKSEILRLARTNTSNVKIGKALKIAESSVRNIIRAAEVVRSKARVGRPKSLTERETRQVIRDLAMDVAILQHMVSFL